MTKTSPEATVLSTREELLAKAAQDFIDKVDRGAARSEQSYAAFKAALSAPAQGAPDAWQRRGKDRYGKWQDWVECSGDPSDQQRWRNIGCEIRALYALTSTVPYDVEKTGGGAS